jgi:hypothetical protein
MAVNYKGVSTRRDYEELGHNLFYLQQKSTEYRNHLAVLSEDTFKKFKLLKEDYEAKFIDTDTYRRFLIPFKSFFESNDLSYSAELQPKVILEAIKALIEKGQ